VEAIRMSEAQVNPTPIRRNQRACRRQLPKGSTKAQATRNSLGLGPNIAVNVLDISERGVRLLLKEKLAPGHEFEVVLESAASRPVKVVAEVIWMVEAADGRFCVGARFVKPISYAEMRALSRQM
jgi:hypothetical protein